MAKVSVTQSLASFRENGRCSALASCRELNSVLCPAMESFMPWTKREFGTVRRAQVVACSLLHSSLLMGPTREAWAGYSTSCRSLASMDASYNDEDRSLLAKFGSAQSPFAPAEFGFSTLILRVMLVGTSRVSGAGSILLGWNGSVRGALKWKGRGEARIACAGYFRCFRTSCTEE